MDNRDFRDIVEAVLVKRNIASLQKIWETAFSRVAEVPVIAYWIRDSDDVINIVWLTAVEVCDVFWFPDPDQSAFNYIPLRNILSFEVRRTKNVAQYHGYKVKGDVLITAYCKPNSPNLFWAANTQKQIKDLEDFSRHLFTIFRKIHADKC